MEEEKRTKMEQWRERASLIEEWLAEEGNKFDEQGVGPASNLDLVKRKREEIEVECCCFFKFKVSLRRNFQ